jgi:hypothetical protein
LTGFVKGFLKVYRLFICGFALKYIDNVGKPWYNTISRKVIIMSTREMLRQEIEILPDELLEPARELISLIYRVSFSSKKEKSTIERGYQLLQKHIKHIDPPIDDEKELMEYLDEKYGPID